MADTTVARTLIQILEAGKGSHPAIVSPDGPTLTYDDLRKQIAKLMDQLTRFGIQRTDRVGIVLPNGVEVIMALLQNNIQIFPPPLVPVGGRSGKPCGSF